VGSEPQEKRLLIKMALSNLALEGKKLKFSLIEPFDKIALYANRKEWLENRNCNITTELACIIKTFEDFRLVAQIREDIEKVKPALIYAA